MRGQSLRSCSAGQSGIGTGFRLSRLGVRLGLFEDVPSCDPNRLIRRQIVVRRKLSP